MNRVIITFIFSIIFPLTQEIYFESANPFSLKDIITNIDNLDKQTVKGTLTIPDNFNKEKFPVVIGVAGSKGWGEHHLKYLKMYQDMGIATFELKSFESRGETSTVGTQNTVTIPMMILDSYRALEELSKNLLIDTEKVAITGWSLGGGVTLYSAWKPVMDAINSDYSFAAHLAFYPPCFSEPNTMEFSESPIHILIGELDQWVPADACVDLCEKMRNVDINANVTVYEGAHHSFDREQELMIAKNGYSFTDCHFKLNDKGAVLMNFLNIPMTNPFLQKIGFSFCAKRDPLFGGHKESREKSFTFSKEFMSKHLLND